MALSAGLRYAVVDNSPKSRAEMDGQADEGPIRAVSQGTLLAEVPSPDRLTGPHAPQGSPDVQVPAQAGRAVPVDASTSS